MFNGYQLNNTKKVSEMIIKQYNHIENPHLSIELYSFANAPHWKQRLLFLYDNKIHNALGPARLTFSKINNEIKISRKDYFLSNICLVESKWADIINITKSNNFESYYNKLIKEKKALTLNDLQMLKITAEQLNCNETLEFINSILIIKKLEGTNIII